MPSNTLILGSLAASGSLYTQDNLLFGKFSDATNFEVDSFIENTSGSLSFDFTNDRFNFNKPVSASVFYGDGSNLTGVSSDPFPYTGDATITGTLTTTSNLDVGGSGSFGNNQFLIGTDNSATNFNSTFEFQNGPSTYSSQLILRPKGNPGGYNDNYWGAIRWNPQNERGLTILAGNYITNIIFGRGAPSSANPPAFAKLNGDGLRIQSSYIQNIATAEERLHVVGNGKFTGFITASGNIETQGELIGTINGGSF